MEVKGRVRKRSSPSVSLSADSKGREARLSKLARHFPRNSHLSQRSFVSEGLVDQHRELPDTCKSCLFVHPHLLLPLLPPASAFTNPCWPPTPPKKRHGLQNSIGIHRVVPDKLSGKAGDGNKSRFPSSLPAGQYRKTTSSCASGSCSYRASTDALSSHHNFPSAAALMQGPNQPCKVCVETFGHQTCLRGEASELAHRVSITGEDEESEAFCCDKRTSCHEAEENSCLIRGGNLFQCACCSLWLPLQICQPASDQRTRADKEATCANVSLDWCQQVDPRCGNRQGGLHDTCCAECMPDCGQRAKAVPKLAEGGARKQAVTRGRRGLQLIPERQATSSFADGAQAIGRANSSSQFVPTHSGDLLTPLETEFHLASEKALKMVVRGVIKKAPPLDNVADTSAPVEEQTHALFAESKPHGILQEAENACAARSTAYTTRLLYGKNTSCAQSVFCNAFHMIHETPGTHGTMHISTIPPAENSHPEPRPELQHPLLGGKSPRPLRALCLDSSSSAGRRDVLLASPARQHSSLNKSSGFSSSVLLPSIGCGLAVAQSSLGRGSGLGLYALRPFSARSRISEYSGLCVDRKVAMLLRSMGTSTHVMRVGMQHQYLVGYRLPFLYGAAGAFINDGRWYADGGRGPGIGARFQVVYDKKRARDRVYVVATRDIKAGEEIFTSYDNLYWALMD